MDSYDDLDAAIIEEANSQSFNETQVWALNIIERVGAMLSLICIGIMFAMAFRHRDRIYHRFILGMSFYLFLLMAWKFVGNWAVPKGTPGAFGAIGNQYTCSAQGFFIQLSLCAPLYYVFLSLYSYVAVRNRFDAEKYVWVEKWIHLAVHSFPVASAIYLLYLDAYNFTGYSSCWLASFPFGCGEHSEDGTVCARGPQNIELYMWIFNGLPVFFVLIFPTIVMTTLYCYVHRSQAKRVQQQVSSSRHDGNPSPSRQAVPIAATDVAKQAGLYLLVLYGCYFFPIVNKAMAYVSDQLVYGLVMGTAIGINTQGVWMLLVYCHFSVVRSDRKSARCKNILCNSWCRMRCCCWSRTHGRSEGGTSQGTNQDDNSKPNTSHGIIRISHTLTMNSAPEDDRVQADEEEEAAASTREGVSMSNASSHQRPTTTITFNIFDGTNASGAFAQYIYDGESEDEEADNKESMHWNSLQNHTT